MTEYTYKGRSASGESVTGTLDAPTSDSVANQLVARKITPIEILEKKEHTSSDIQIKSIFPPKPPTLNDLSMFCRQMKALSKAGIPIVQAISGLAEHARSPILADALKDIVVRLSTGSPLATSLGAHPNIFSELFIGLVHVGESTGKLDDAFAKLIHHLEMERETKSRVSQAVRYPTMVMGSMVVAMFIINMFVIPAFAGVFEKLGAELPLPTKILMITSSFTVKYWWLMLIVIVGSIVMFLRYIKTEKGEYWWDKKKIKLPIIGPIFEKTALSRFTRSFAMMFESGVPILQSLGIVEGTVGNKYISGCIADMKRGIERGDSLARTAAATEMFTPLILQMISVGEETGSIDALLNDVSDFYEEEVDYDLKQLSDSIEPIILVALGVMVLILALGVFLPMWNMGSAMKH